MDIVQLRRTLDLSDGAGIMVRTPGPDGWAAVETVDEHGPPELIGHWTSKGFFRHLDGSIVEIAASETADARAPNATNVPTYRTVGTMPPVRTRGDILPRQPQRDIAPILRTLPRVAIGWFVWKQFLIWVGEPFVILLFLTYLASGTKFEKWVAVSWLIWLLWIPLFLKFLHWGYKRAAALSDTIEDGLYDFAHPRYGAGSGPTSSLDDDESTRVVKWTAKGEAICPSCNRPQYAYQVTDPQECYYCFRPLT